jgi:aminoglycoside phosphotransferase (APT) family kinase protein
MTGMMAAGGKRIGWSDLPSSVRAQAQRIIGDGPVVEVCSQTGGFSPGTADRVRTGSGRRAFVKAVSVDLNEDSARLARQELRITAVLPERAPVPRLLGGYDDGEWVLLVLEDIQGVHPRTPWVDDEIDAAMVALRDLAATLTPAPACGVPTAVESLAGDFAGWDRIAAAPPQDLGPWAVTHLEVLTTAAHRATEVLAHGDTLAHTDIRADNMLVRADGRIVIVDWPWACIGPEWLDTVFLAVNVIVHGGDGERVLAGLNRDAAVAVIAGMTGYFQYTCRQPPVSALPTVRAFQRFQGDALLQWLKTVLTS